MSLSRKPSSADHQVADLLDRSELALRVDAVASLVVADQAGGIREIHLLQFALQIDQVDAVRHHAVGDQFDADLVRLDALEVDPGHAGNALQWPHQLAHQHVVGAGQVAFAGNAQPEHRLIGKIELEHVDAANVGGQLVADRLDAFARLHGLDRHVLAPVENDFEIGAAVRWTANRDV